MPQAAPSLFIYVDIHYYLQSASQYEGLNAGSRSAQGSLVKSTQGLKQTSIQGCECALRQRRLHKYKGTAHPPVSAMDSIPRTPTPDRRRAQTPEFKPANMTPDGKHTAPALTPPPSANAPNNTRPLPRLADPAALSPPPTVESVIPELPSVEAVQLMQLEELRALVSSLLPALGAARVNVAHARLQHTLLSIEKNEAVSRAEVEHEATRREVQVLQQSHDVRPSLHASDLHVALRHCRELQNDTTALHRRLRASKKLIVRLDGKVMDLKEENTMLRRRIRDNRSHIYELQDAGAINLSPLIGDRVTPRSAIASRETMVPSSSQTSHDPFDALLQASHVLNTATTSDARQTSYGRHVRGAHSLSSLPSTPVQKRARETPHTTIGMQQRPRDDRESTISASDAEDQYSSNASPPTLAAPYDPQPALRQAHIYGQVTKPLHSQHGKRPASQHSVWSSKRLKTGPTEECGRRC